MIGLLAGRLPNVPLALRTVAYNRLRLLVAIGGISFAIVFMFLQLTFLNGLDNTAVGIIRQFDADLILTSPRFLHLGSPGSIERTRLSQVKASPFVRSSAPLALRLAEWQAVNTARKGRVFVIGLNVTAGENPLLIEGLEGQLGEVNNADVALVDLVRQPKLGDVSVGAKPRLGGTRITIGGNYRMGVGFFASGSVIVSTETFAKVFKGAQTQLGLVKLVAGADREAAAADLRRLLPADTKVITRQELLDRQRRFWVQDTALGNVFMVGTLLGFSVGLVVLYQVLSTDITNQLPQYATLKAMGYRERSIYAIVLRQAAIIAVLAYLPALFFTYGVCEVMRGVTLIPVFMTFERASGVFLLSLSMCTVSAVVAARRITLADPAELF